MTKFCQESVTNSNPLKDFLVHPLLCVLSDKNHSHGAISSMIFVTSSTKMGVGNINVIKIHVFGKFGLT